jgi:hypothetical protein
VNNFLQGCRAQGQKFSPKRDLQSQLDDIPLVNSLTGTRLQKLLDGKATSAGAQQTAIGPEGLDGMNLFPTGTSPS